MAWTLAVLTCLPQASEASPVDASFKYFKTERQYLLGGMGVDLGGVEMPSLGMAEDAGTNYESGRVYMCARWIFGFCRGFSIDYFLPGPYKRGRYSKSKFPSGPAIFHCI